MPMPPEEPQPDPIPGQIYYETGVLYYDLDRAKSQTIKIFGKTLNEKPSETLPGETFLEITDTPEKPENFFVARVFQANIDHTHPYTAWLNMEAIDYLKRVKVPGTGAEKPKSIPFKIDPKNITSWHIEIVPGDQETEFIRKLWERK